MQCGDDDSKALSCERAQESPKIAASNGAALRHDSTLTLKSEKRGALVVKDWQKCAPKRECDGERFIYLGTLEPSSYAAIEIAYGHDSPSLILFQAKSGKIAFVHYGSEPTFLNRSGTLLVSYEDLNDATSLLVTDLVGDAPVIDLQCLGARAPEKSFAISFKRWTSSDAFDLVVTETHGTTEDKAVEIPVRFVRSASGTWTIESNAALDADGFSCRQRASA